MCRKTTFAIAMLVIGMQVSLMAGCVQSRGIPAEHPPSSETSTSPIAQTPEPLSPPLPASEVEPQFVPEVTPAQLQVSSYSFSPPPNPPFPLDEVAELATKIHNDAWFSMLSQAQTDDYSRYGIYAARVLAVKHPEVYLKGDGIFVSVITSNPGFKKAYETKDVDSSYLGIGSGRDGPPFSFELVRFNDYKVIADKDIYPHGYPVFPFVDRRLGAISTTLKTSGDRITELEKAEQIYFRERLAGKKDIYLIYCENEKAYVYLDGILLGARDENRMAGPEGDPVLIFNEDFVWYPLMDRDDTVRSIVLKELVSKYSTQKISPDLFDIEKQIINQLKKVSEITKYDGLRYAGIKSIGGIGPAFYAYLSTETKKELSGLLSTPPTRAINEKSSHISPTTAYLAAIAVQVTGPNGIRAMSEEYLKHSASPTDPSVDYGHTWFCAMMERNIEYSYRSRAGHCSETAANLAAVLDLAGIDRYRMAAFMFLGAKNERWSGHDFIYVPETDLIISNGAVLPSRKTVVTWAGTSPALYLYFIEYRDQWKEITAPPGAPTIAGGGTLSPDKALEIIEYLRNIYGDDLQAGRIVDGKLVPIPFDQLTSLLFGVPSTWGPYKLLPSN